MLVSVRKADGSLTQQLGQEGFESVPGSFNESCSEHVHPLGHWMSIEWLIVTLRPCRYRLTGSILDTNFGETSACVPSVLGSQHTLGLLVLPAAIGVQLENCSGVYV